MALNSTFKKINAPLVMGMFLVSLSLVGHGEGGLASMVIGPLQIHHERVTGSVNQLPLRLILDQVQAQLGIAYQAPKEELEQRVSVDLHGESLPQALAKILAPWDYALTIDPAGKVQAIFVVRKIPAGGPEEQAIQAESDRHVTPPSNRGSKRDRKIRETPKEVVMDESKEDPPFENSHPILEPDPPQQDPKDLWDVMDESGMERVPSGDVPGMEVHQVSEEAQKAILQILNPPTIGSFEEAGYEGINIAPVSEEEAQEILQSLNRSIGSSRDVSLP